jgi:hypothetical protein
MKRFMVELPKTSVALRRPENTAEEDETRLLTFTVLAEAPPPTRCIPRASVAATLSLAARLHSQKNVTAQWLRCG